MTLDQRRQAARAFWRDEGVPQDQVQAVLLISQHKNFRPKTVVSFDEERKARHLASLASLPDEFAARALIVYHLAEQRPMMSAFLDALGIAHENGLIQDDLVAPDPAKVGPAVSQLARQFAPESVSLYLGTLLCQDARMWASLEPFLTQQDSLKSEV